MPLFYQPEPHGAAESDAYDSLLAAGWSIRLRHGLITHNDHPYIRAEKNGLRTRSHRMIRDTWADARTMDATAARNAMLAADGRDHSARAVLARLPVINDPIISVAMRALEDDEDETAP